MSPDMNPIENLWGRIVRNWDAADERTTEDLHAHVMRQWEGFRGDAQYFDHLGTI